MKELHHNFKYLVWKENGFMMKIKTQENQFRKNFLGKLKIFFVLDLSILKWHNHENESLEPCLHIQHPLEY